nr:MAG TPA: hypothetical protein [Caudoviricetes sp.]
MRYYFIQNAKIIPKKFGSYIQIAYLCTVFSTKHRAKDTKKVRDRQIYRLKKE